jgi:hypothetical protein
VVAAGLAVTGTSWWLPSSAEWLERSRAAVHPIAKLDYERT